MTQPPWDEFDALYAAFAREHHAPGLVAGAIVGGRLVHHYSYGVADSATGASTTIDHRFRIASMSKSFTALALLSLRDRNRLSLDAPVAEFVPEIAQRRPATADSAAVTVRDLMHHLGGNVTDDPWGDRQLGISPADFSAYLRSDWPAARPPGAAFEYSNLGYALLGRVITTITEMPYQAFVRELLFAPLGMTSTTYDVNDVPPGHLATPHRWAVDTLLPAKLEGDGEFGAMGGIITTLADFARYAGWILDAWPPRDGPDDGPVRRSTLRELAVGHGFPQLVRRDPTTPTTAGIYGHGFVVQHDPELGQVMQHSGGLPGYGSNVYLLPAMATGIIGFANVTYAAPLAVNRAAAVLLRDAGVISDRAVRLSEPLERALVAAAAGYDTGSLGPVEDLAADNLFADIPAVERLAALQHLRAEYGDRLGSAYTPEHDLAGVVTLTCERGRIRIQVRLAPTAELRIQLLTMTSG